MKIHEFDPVIYPFKLWVTKELTDEIYDTFEMFPDDGETNIPDVYKRQDGDFKMVNGAEMSAQFKFEFETQLELIFNALGIVCLLYTSSTKNN